MDVDDDDDDEADALARKVRLYQEGLQREAPAVPPSSTLGATTEAGSVLSHTSSIASVVPGDSASQLSFASSKISKKRRSAHYTPSPKVSPIVTPTTSRPPTLQDVSIFEDALISCFASANIAFNVVENPQFRQLINICVPGMKIPSRKTLSGRILNTKLATVRHDVKWGTRNRLATLQCDGWTGRNSQHLVAFMITTLGGSELDYQVR